MRSRTRWLVLACGLVLAASNCSIDLSEGGGRSQADPTSGGSLVVLTQSGSKAVYAPPRSPYYFTHGFVVCRGGGSPGQAPVLRSISYKVKLKPIDIRPAFRRIPAAPERRGGGPYDWAPIGGLVGRPGDFDGWSVRGDFSYRYDGTKVTVPCNESSDPTAALMELEIVMKVPREGSDIDGFTITYEVGGKSHKLHVPWRMVGCGSKVARTMCTPP